MFHKNKNVGQIKNLANWFIFCPAIISFIEQIDMKCDVCVERIV